MEKLLSTIKRCEFAFKCLYPGEKPLSKEDYARIRFTHRVLCEKYDSLLAIRTRGEIESSNKGVRTLQLQKYLIGTGMSFEEALQIPEIERYINDGEFRAGGFIDKYVRMIHQFYFFFLKQRKIK